MSAPLLRLEGVTIDVQVGPDLRRVVHDVSFELGVGEILGLIGESGSGKSMTARAIVRNLPAGTRVGGTVAFDGRELSSLSRSELRRYRRSDVGMIFQDPRVHINPVRTIGDFLTEGMRAQGLSRRRAGAQALGLLQDVRLANPAQVLRKYPHELSGGMLQRVMIAGAISTGPRLLIADEPTTALDVTTQAEIVGIVQELSLERGLSVVFITHDLDLATAICDRTAVCYAGRIVEEQPATALHSVPLHPYTRGLLASRPSVSSGGSRLVPLPGAPVSAWQVAAGCAFASRCPDRLDECTTTEQVLSRAGAGRVACMRVDGLADDLSQDGALHG